MPKPRTRKESNAFEENRVWFDAALKKSRLTQREIAGRLKITEGSVSLWKKSGQISSDHIMAICELLDISPPSWLQAKDLEESEQPRVTETLLRIQSLYEAGHLTLDDLLHLERIALHIAGLRQALEHAEKD